MKNKKLLAAILLSLSFCFVSAGARATISKELIEGTMPAHHWWKEMPLIDSRLFGAMANYNLQNPVREDYFSVRVAMWYDKDGSLGKELQPPLIFGTSATPRFCSFPENVQTTGKILIYIDDNIGYFSLETLSPFLLLELFEKQLNIVYRYIDKIATDMDNDVVALLRSPEYIPLAYFSEGEYYLWEELK